MKRLRHDLNYLTSGGLLVTAVLTGATGVVADLWDLNDFWYHTLAGYAMGVFAVAHVILNWHSLVAYARFRLMRRSTDRPAAPARAGPTAPGPVSPALRASAEDPRPSLRWAGRQVLSRRGVLGLAAGGLGGWVIGRGLRPPPPIPAGSDVGVVYHQWSKPGVIDVLGSVANWGQQPPLYKEYPDAVSIPLPEPRLEGGLPTEEAISTRRSTRQYSGEPMSLEELSRVLYLASGISADRWGSARRTAPSSGALYPIEIYPVVHKVTGLTPGVYHYAFREHSLALIRAEDLREHVVQQGLMQEYLGQCNVVLFLTNVMQRMRFKYKDRSYRYGLLEAGHIGQNLYLAASSMGLGACAIGAFMDDEINTMLGVDGVEEAAVYMLAVGKPA
ncbi:MAG: SagB family peptide dehydrogenase [Chloroflexi bacterium]|nr:SagB family peptide dehydrogenase [Chloroflexota bacterium]